MGTSKFKRPWKHGTQMRAEPTLGGTTADLESPPAPALESDNRLGAEDRRIHRWYRFVLSFPPHLVRHYVRKFDLGDSSCLLDPFCGTGTTLVEAKRLGVPSVGIEAHPLTSFAASVKIDWTPDPRELLEHARGVAAEASLRLADQGVPDTPLERYGENSIRRRPKLRKLNPELSGLLLTNSISPRPLHKALVLLEVLERNHDDRYRAHEMLGLAQSIVDSSSNLHFGPEVGVGKIRPDAPVVAPWLQAISEFAQDLTALEGRRGATSKVYTGDARDVSRYLPERSVDGVITSPPYPNEKDYTRTTRLESVLLGLVRNRSELQAIKQNLVRSNTRGIFKADTDDALVRDDPEINRIASDIEARRIQLGKTSGFERLYHRAAKLYFGGMLMHLSNLRPALHPGARLAYVVGDQASYLRVMIRTGGILGRIAQRLGYEWEGTDLFRTRYATATGEQLREEVVLLRWPGEG